MRRILLIDDDETFRTMLRVTLGRMSFEVVEARNGKEGLTLFQKQPPDLVLTDLIMPEKEGIETIQEIKKSHPSAKIIAMSGGGRLYAQDLLQIAKPFGAAYTLKKPFSNHELAVAIEHILGEGKLRQME